MIISFVHKKSPAARMGLQRDDEVLQIDNHPIRDPIDFQFYSSEDSYSLLIRRGREERSYAVGADDSGWLGIEFADMEYRSCGNKCIFCFVDQNPAGLRDALYFKDEDYRLSFLYGNYVTLTNVSRSDLERIVEQRLSPLYVSVHSTEEIVRRRMLGLAKDDRLLEKIAFLADSGIELHAQIVLCPGYNDGEHLTRTLNDLAAFSPAVQTVAVVPLGLTGHREQLTRMRTVTADEAKGLLIQEKSWAESFRSQLGSAFVYFADEFYLLAGEDLPHAERYDGYAQIENGVGLTRQFLDLFQVQKRRFPKEIKPIKVTVATGNLAAPVLDRFVLPVLKQISGLDVELVPIANRFYGGGVTVSGLLVGQDFAEQLRGRMQSDLLLLPPNCRNYDGLFLDGWDVPSLARELNTPIFAPDDQFGELFTYLKSL